MRQGLSKSELARQLGVSRSSLYYKPKIPDKDEELRRQIESVMKEHPGYGHRRVAYALKINRKRALRVMKKYNLKPARRCKSPSKKEDVGKEASQRPDILKTLSPIAPNVVWTGDFTFISFQGKHIYLAVVQDRFAAFVYGANIMLRHTKELVIVAFEESLRNSATKPDWWHSDQGSEYTSEDFENLLLSNGISISHAPKSSPWRNGSQESFFARFKIEFGDADCYETLEELMEAIYKYIHYYNYERIHTRLRTTPNNFIKEYHQRQKMQLAPNLPRQQQLSTASSDETGRAPFSEAIDNCSPPPHGHPFGVQIF